MTSRVPGVAPDEPEVLGQADPAGPANPSVLAPSFWQRIGQRLSQFGKPAGVGMLLRPETVNWADPAVVAQKARLTALALRMYDPDAWGGPGREDFLDRTVRRIIELGQDNPEILNLADRSFTAAAGVSYADFVARSLTGDPADPIGMGRRFVDAAYDLLNEEETALLSPKRAAETAENATTWNAWLAQGTAQDALNELISTRTDEQIAALLQRAGIDPAEVEQSNMVTPRELVRKYAMSSLRLLPDRPAGDAEIVVAGSYVGFNWPTAEGDDQWVRVRVKDGWNVASPLDAIDALVRAATGEPGFEVHGLTAEMLGRQTETGWLWQRAGDALRVLERPFLNTNGWWTWINNQADEAWDAVAHGDPFEYNPDLSSSTTLRQMTAEAQAQQQLAEMSTPEAIAAAMADSLYQQYRTEGMTAGMAFDAGQTWLASASPEEIAETQETYARDLSAAGMDERLTEAFKGEYGLDATLSQSYEWFIEGLDLYNKTLLELGTTALDALGDIGQGLLDAAGVPGPWDKTAEFNPIEAFKANWDHTAAKNLSEYWNIDDPTLGFIADMAGSIVFDPFTWITPGVGAYRGWADGMLSRPGGADVFLRQATVNRKAFETVRRLERGDLGWVANQYLSEGMRYEHLSALYQAKSVDEVRAVFRRALPNGGDGGTWLPSLSGHWARRNSATQIRRLAELAGKGDSAISAHLRGWITDSLGGYSRDLKVSVAPWQMPHDFAAWLDWRFAHLPEREAIAAQGPWLRRLDDLWRSASEETNVLRASGEARLQAAQTGLAKSEKELGSEVRRVLGDMGWTPKSLRTAKAQPSLTGMLDDLARAESRIDVLRQEIDHLPTLGMGADDLAREIGKRQDELRMLEGEGFAELQRLDAERKALGQQYAASPQQAAKFGKPVRPPEVEARIREIGKRMAELRKDPMLRGYTSADAVIRRLSARQAETAAETVRLGHEIETAKALVARGTTRDFREMAAQLWAEFQDDWAQDLVLPVVKGRKNPLTGGPRYDWSEVTGHGGTDFGLADTPRMWAIAGDDDELAKAIRKAGFYNTQSEYRMPASPMMIAAYRYGRDGGWWGHFLSLATRGPRTGWEQAVYAPLNFQRRAFSTILESPRLAFRSNLDEPIRGVVSTGRLLGSREIIGLTDEAAPIIGGRLPGYPSSAVGQFQPTSRFGREWGERTLRAVREEGTPSNPTAGIDPGAWGVVSARGMDEVAGVKPVVDAKLHKLETVRYFNGTWMQEEVSGAFSRSVQATATKLGRSPFEVIDDAALSLSNWDLTAFRNWWWERGRFSAQGLKVKPGEALSLTGFDDAARAMVNSLRFRASISDAPKMVVDGMVERAALGRPLQLKNNADEALIRNFGPVLSDRVGVTMPGPSLIRKGKTVGRALAGAQDRVNGVLYGVPGQNRYGLTHARHYSQALGILAEGNRGRILTPGKLAELAQAGKVPAELADLSKAQDFFASHLDMLDTLAHQNGLVTVHMLQNAADSFAREWARHMMYQPGATSMLGKAMQLGPSPFGPAQFDYLSWYGWELTRATTVGMFGHYAQVPNILNVPRMAANVGRRIAGKPTVPLGALPLNLRLLSRTASLGGLISPDLENPYGEDDPARLTFNKMVEEFTFLPTLKNTADMLMDFGPSIGPLPSWMIRLLPDPDSVEEGSWLWNVGQEVRRTFESLVPAAGWADSMEWGNWQEMGVGLLDAMFPANQGSPRDIIRLFYDMGSKLAGGQDMGAHTAGLARPPMYREAFDYVLAQELMGREGLRAQPYGTSESAALLARIQADAERMASLDDWIESAFRFLPGARLLYSEDDLATPLYEGFLAEVDTLVSWGAMGQPTADDMAADWAAYKDGTISDKQISDLHDSVKNTLFGLRDLEGGYTLQSYLICKHPELAILLTGRYEAAQNPDGSWKAPEGWVSGDGRPSLPAGDEGLARLVQGLEMGWFTEKSEGDRLAEIEYRIASAQRNVLSEAYKALTGRTEFDAGQEIVSRDTTVFTLDAQTKNLLALTGMVALTGDLPDRIAGDDLARRFDQTRDSLRFDNPRQSVSAEVTAKLSQSESGYAFLQSLADLDSAATDAGYESPQDWPDEWLAAVRQDFGLLVSQGAITEEDYNKAYARLYGQLDWALDIPPTIDALPDGTQVLRLDPDQAFVVDGDTVDVRFADGQTSRFRLVGINAPDQPMPGAEQSTADLIRLLHEEGYDDIALVFYKPETFGTTAGTDFKTGKPRWKAWLYVNGQPIFNPDVFSFSNPLGRGTGIGFSPLPRPELVEAVA